MPDSLTIRQLVNPTPEELEATAQVAVAAFYGDECTRISLGGDWNLNPAEQRAIINAQQIGGENWVACDGDKIIALAGWYGPGRAFLDSPDQVEAGWNDFAAQMPSRLHDWWMNECLPQYDATVDVALGKGVKKNIWHLQLLATHPDYQKCGIGEALVKHKERLIALAGDCSLMCLESEKLETTKLYQKWGWEVRGEHHFDTLWGEFGLWVQTKVPVA
ncbi:hypothetical protein EIP91_001442 [Steccherinum ochraceum]|uniref:N-acetyltransferase domain-containing protein n=1 Tax=Steccherinum ochraceum TaxID=92696 RepID=A0A4R0RR74_9APHY|nr:hypothetical protein EIP91_001442 [Steccherinum ochraceum]